VFQPDCTETTVDPRQAAEATGLHYVEEGSAGLRRRRSGKGFAYYHPNGARIAEAPVLDRIRSLAIPPAWADVWICPSASGHIQATGRDAKGRKQYRYHASFRAMREGSKFEHILGFAAALPKIRAAVDSDMSRKGLPREKVLAAVVHLLEATLIRVGNDDYARRNKSYGLTTLKTRHVSVEGSDVRFRFTGKSGKRWLLSLKDRRIAAIIRKCQELPGQELLQYVDDDGANRDVTSGDVNAYLREITGQDVTAKDFRTWAGTVLAALALQEFEKFDSAAQAKRNLRRAIETVAARLGNTPTICRKCYVHPEVMSAYLDGNLVEELQAAIETEWREDLGALKPEEVAVMAMLRTRLAGPGARKPAA